MQYATVFLAALAATGAFAAPQGKQTDKQVKVTLGGSKAIDTILADGRRDVARPAQSGPFKTVTLDLGDKVKSKDLRCQILDENNKPIVVKRGENTDITFGDGDKGAWTFRNPAKVSSIICDPSFKKIDASALEIRVVLSNQATETGSQTTFAEGKRDTKTPTGSTGPYQTVELRLGQLVDPAYRCKIVDKAGMDITVIRGENVATTFGDGGKGAWTLKKTAEVSKIICDPSFRK